MLKWAIIILSSWTDVSLQKLKNADDQTNHRFSWDIFRTPFKLEHVDSEFFSPVSGLRITLDKSELITEM